MKIFPAFLAVALSTYACAIPDMFGPIFAPLPPTVSAPPTKFIPPIAPDPTRLPPTESPVTPNDPPQLYAGFTQNDEIPFVIVHPSGEMLGVIADLNASDTEGYVWTSSSGESFVFHVDEAGFPKSAVLGEDIILYTNYTNTTVDITIIHPDGRREVFRSKYTADLLDANRSLASIYDPVSYSVPGSIQPQEQHVWGYINEGLFALEVASCTLAGYAVAPTIAGLGVVAAACHGPLLELKIRENKAENMDVRNLEALQLGLNIGGCALQNPMDCVNLFVSEMAEDEEEANRRLSDVPGEPTDTKKYN